MARLWPPHGAIVQSGFFTPGFVNIGNFDGMYWVNGWNFTFPVEFPGPPQLVTVDPPLNLAGYAQVQNITAAQFGPQVFSVSGGQTTLAGFNIAGYRWTAVYVPH